MLYYNMKMIVDVEVTLDQVTWELLAVATKSNEKQKRSNILTSYVRFLMVIMSSERALGSICEPGLNCEAAIASVSTRAFVSQAQCRGNGKITKDTLKNTRTSLY